MYLLKVPYILSEPIARGTRHCDRGSFPLRDSLGGSPNQGTTQMVMSAYLPFLASLWYATSTFPIQPLILVGESPIQ